MKSIFQRLIAALICFALIAPAGAAFAESGSAGSGKPDILMLMDAASVPVSKTVIYGDDLSLEGAQQKHWSQDLVSSGGDVLHVQFDFELQSALSDAQWQTVTDWLKQLVLGAVQQVKADPESLANVISQAYTAQRTSAQPGETGLPVWANAGVRLRRITATVPYFPELQVGVNGSATQRLQEKLIQLGFLNDRADGYYGENTKKAVMGLERYVQSLEADAYAAQPKAESSLLNLFAPASAEVEDVPTFQSNTAVDGVADALLQAYLYSEGFRSVRAEADVGNTGVDVARIQTRLSNLGYLSAEVDGNYGTGTAYSLRIFQYYNGIAQTGRADADTQRLLFSERAVKPDNSMLTPGASGDAVSSLQRRLRVLGFGTLAVDGSYGASTKTGVENLQQYMQATGLAAGAMDVNGIADPILLDAFYASSFPEIPGAMRTGSTGADVVRLQRRLNCLEYYTGAIDGDYGDGTAKAVGYFQKLNGLSQTGEAGTETLQRLFNADAQKALRPYLLRVSRADQRVYVYALDSNLKYTNLVKTMKCSTGRSGSETPAGTYTSTTGPGARWHYFKKFDCWAQYAYYIQGDIMFHSVLYGSKGGSVTRSSVNNLGHKASHGCVRLSVEDAKWIWSNCAARTTVIVE